MSGSDEKVTDPRRLVCACALAAMASAVFLVAWSAAPAAASSRPPAWTSDAVSRADVVADGTRTASPPTSSASSPPSVQSSQGTGPNARFFVVSAAIIGIGVAAFAAWRHRRGRDSPL